MALKQKILAMTLPTDILHRATLIKFVMIRLYNDVLMDLPATEEDLVSRHKEILSFSGLVQRTRKPSRKDV